jgi:hypothetical protein
MRSSVISSLVILLLAMQGQVGTQAADRWRVVVQDAIPEVLSVASDGKLIATRGRWSRHVFHVLNHDASQILLTVHLPRAIFGAAIAESGEWFVVSTEEHIYRIGLADGSAEILLEGVAGSVALDQDGERVAVLGQLGEDAEGRRSRFMARARLGVYDLKQGRWLARADTPILVDHVVTFDGNDVVAAGRGGRVFHRAASSYPCYVRLDPDAGQTTMGRGPETGPGVRPKGEPKPLGDYSPPDSIQTTRKKLEAAEMQVKARREDLSAGAPVRPGDHFALTADDKQVLTVIDHGSGKRSLLTIHPDGDVSVRGVEIGSGLVYCGGRLLGRHGGRERDTMIDLQTEQEVFSVPSLSPSDRDGWVRFLPAGCLVREDGRLKFYQPNKPGSVWERDVPEGLDNPFPLRSSPDKGRFALGFGGNSDTLVLVVSAETGKTIGRIPRPDGKDHSGYPLAAAFSRDGKRLVLVHQRSLRVYDVASGQVGYERALAEKEYLWSATGVDKGWLLGADDQSLFLDEGQKAEVRIPLRRIDKAMPVSQTERQTLSVETSSGLGGIVTRNGKVLTSWVNEEIGGLRNDANAPPLSGVAFKGRLIARLTGGPEVELIDARMLEPIARIHIVKLAEGWGWIVYTADGYWDSSPGAERYVVVFKNGKLAPPVETRSRRIKSLLKSRLPH